MTGKAAISVPGQFATLGNHASATSAMKRNDVDAAIGLLDGTRFGNSRQEVSGGPRWGALQWHAATLVVQAHDAGRPINDDVMLTAYQTLARSYDLIEASRYVELSRSLIVRKFGEKSPAILKLALDDNVLMLAYFRAGGQLNLDGTTIQIDTMYINDAHDRYAGTPMAYDFDLLVGFPLRLSREDRELFFELNRLTLLPRDQWHDVAALKRMMRDDEYLRWLHEKNRAPGAIFWRLSRALNAQLSMRAICHARAAGFDVRPAKNAPPDKVNPPQCLANDK